MPIPSDLTHDQQLASRIASGDERAFRDFYEMYANPLYVFIYHLSGEVREDAEEIWQDTLLAALDGISRYQGQSRLFSWLCAIARRKVVDFYRRYQRKGETLSLEADGKPLELIDSAPLPEDVINNRAVRARVVEVLENLPEEYREGLIARYAGGCSVEEISQRLHKTYKATESLLSRARQVFKDTF